MPIFFGLESCSNTTVTSLMFSFNSTCKITQFFFHRRFSQDQGNVHLNLNLSHIYEHSALLLLIVLSTRLVMADSTMSVLLYETAIKAKSKTDEIAISLFLVFPNKAEDDQLAINAPHGAHSRV